MAYVESHQSLLNHHKLLDLCSALGCGEVLMIGHLHCLWWWCLDNVSPDGALGTIRNGVIARAARWEGDADTFAEALASVGFLDVTPAGRFVHDWMDYAGKYQAKKAVDVQRKREARAAQYSRTSNGNPTEIPGTSDGNPTDVAAHAGAGAGPRPDSLLSSPNGELGGVGEREVTGLCPKAPTREQVTVYMGAIGHPEMAEPFFDYWSARGWHAGPGRSVAWDYQAACRTWVANQSRFPARASPDPEPPIRRITAKELRAADEARMAAGRQMDPQPHA